ncbi:MAG TPA: hypothetical protein VF829_01210 [Candidatus Paceibacterota bacterium]
MANQEMFQKVRELNLPIGTYALFGSAPLGIRNLKDCHDVDIVVTEDLWNQYKAQGWEVRSMSHGSEFLCSGDLELWKDWKPGEWDIAELIDTAEVIDGLPFVMLDRVLKWKELSGREKDLRDVELIREYMNG